MAVKKEKKYNSGLSYLEKLISNTFFVLILLYTFTMGYYRELLVMKELNNAAMLLWGCLTGLFVSLWFLFALGKSVLICENQSQTQWSFCRWGVKHTFEIGSISSVKKSFWGLYSSFLIVAGEQRIRIPAESGNLTEFISTLSQHLSKEQVSDLLQYHQRATAVCFEMEKKSKFLRIICFFIVPVSFFIAANVWEFFSAIFCIAWVSFSLIYPLFWTAVHWVLLKISAKNFTVFSRISAIWTVFGITLYMFVGICYRLFYLGLIYYPAN